MNRGALTFLYAGSFGREHPEICKDAADGKKDAETDAENSVPVFREIAFHIGIPFCCGDGCADGAHVKRNRSFQNVGCPGEIRLNRRETDPP